MDTDNSTINKEHLEHSLTAIKINAVNVYVPDVIIVTCVDIRIRNNIRKYISEGYMSNQTLNNIITSIDNTLVDNIKKSVTSFLEYFNIKKS